MSAKMETFFELKKVVDHDCGNYRMGEIDYVNYDAIKEYVNQYGDFAEAEIYRVCAKVMFTAQNAAIAVRNKEVGGGSCMVAPENFNGPDPRHTGYKA